MEKCGINYTFLDGELFLSACSIAKNDISMFWKNPLVSTAFFTHKYSCVVRRSKRSLFHKAIRHQHSKTWSKTGAFSADRQNSPFPMLSSDTTGRKQFLSTDSNFRLQAKTERRLQQI